MQLHLGTSIAEGVSGFLGWWVSELRDLLPVTRQTSTTAVRRVVISLEGDGARLLREDGTKLTAIHIDGADDTPVPVSRAIDMVAAMAPRLPVGIRVPQESCFTRTIPLPATARRDFARILALDLERSTPLRPADIYTAHIVDGVATTKGMLDVRHFMLKRRTIDPVVSELAARGLRPIFADCWSADRRSAVPVNFLNDPTDQHRGGGVRVVSLLGCTALLLGLTATLLLRSKQAEALATLDTATAQLSEQARAAGAVRERSVAATRTADQLARLLAGRRPAVQLIEELSRLLPDHTHLTALRLDGDSIEISGLTPSAAALLPLLEGSELFHDARLAAPVQLESEKDRERFQIAAKLRRAGDATPTRGRP